MWGEAMEPADRTMRSASTVKVSPPLSTLDGDGPGRLAGGGRRGEQDREW